jgi:proline iminopeptidase
MAASGEGVRRTLYPLREPVTTGFLEVDAEVGHRLWYAVYGSTDPAAPTAVYLHGGPAAGSSPAASGFFADKYRVLVFDQRACGKSTPNGEMRNNTTWHLVEDIEK